jgi:hypothetical protein
MEQVDLSTAHDEEVYIIGEDSDLALTEQMKTVRVTLAVFRASRRRGIHNVLDENVRNLPVSECS